MKSISEELVLVNDYNKGKKMIAVFLSREQIEERLFIKAKQHAQTCQTILENFPHIFLNENVRIFLLKEIKILEEAKLI